MPPAVIACCGRPVTSLITESNALGSHTLGDALPRRDMDQPSTS
jgi:hypothetical protein